MADPARESERVPMMRRISEYLWEVPSDFQEGMRVPARIFASERILSQMDSAVFQQIANVASLPGIVRCAYCMPDGHSGYGFPIGGVAAMDPETGVISPGGIGFDINCGMRLVTTRLTEAEVRPRLKELVDRLYERVPAGVGSTGFLRLTPDEFLEVAARGAPWCLERGYARAEDLDLTEDGGHAAGADPSRVSAEAVLRGAKQLGTLGAGNHYLEIQVAKPENVYDPAACEAMGIRPDEKDGQVVVMFHCGSRGFGHQVATDYLRRFLSVMGSRYGIQVRDRELACAPFHSPEGQDYFAAMKCAINISFVNRQMILHAIREVFSEVFSRDASELGLDMVYDVAHNTAKIEEHWVDGRMRQLLVHRKGATRAFGPGASGLPSRYERLGQPVIIGGSMESGSYLLLGVQSGVQSFFSTAHGSGRTMSRTRAKKQYRGRDLSRAMAERGIYVRSVSWSGLAEEAGAAYKDIDQVTETTEKAGLSRRVVRLVPIGNVKG